MSSERWQKIEDLFNSALDLEPDRREQFLKQACAGDESVYEEVQRLLKLEAEPEDLIDSPAMEILAHKIAKDSKPPKASRSVIGETIGRYRVVKQIGKGGMGEVYQAKDRKLDRDVAIKILPEEFAGDPDRLGRFRREAKVLASLSHPNIATLYELEESEEIHFIVLEMVEGETLADRIRTGPIAIEESLKLSLQIAEALEMAHEKGIIHRDLKPANIKITPEGKVKVLDFGLAKTFAKEPEDRPCPPESSDAITQKGLILGTAAYMSPEQAKGKNLDKRTDVWSFGVVLFEMLTGQKLFTGDSPAEILSTMLKEEPDFSRLPSNLHPRIRLLLERCLVKEVRDRYGSIADARVDIEKALADSGGISLDAASPLESGRGLRLWLPWMIAAVILAAIIVGAIVWKLRTPETLPVVRFEYDLPEVQQLVDLSSPLLAVSPDGKRFVYNTSSGLYLRSMDQPTAKLILGADKNPKQPFFSPDGQWVGYWSSDESQLKKVSIRGGAPVHITDVAGDPVLPSWDVDDAIVYGQYGTGKIMRVPGSGGTPELLFEQKGNLIFAPQILPGGKSVLFTQLHGREYRIMVQSLDSGQSKALTENQGAICISRYVKTGHIVYVVGNNLFAVPFDFEKSVVTGGPVPMAEGILWAGIEGAPQFALSDSGTLIYVLGTVSAAPQRTLVWVNKAGVEQSLGTPLKSYMFPRISPDGTRVALAAKSEKSVDIWIWEIARKTLIRLTFDGMYNLQPIWTPDGKKIVFSSTRDGVLGIYWKAADGTGKVEKLFSAPGRSLFPWFFSRDGKTLIMSVVDSLEPSTSSKFDVSMLSIKDRMQKPLLQTEHLETQPKISPDGQWMAYTSGESSGERLKGEVYVRPFPEVDKGKYQVSNTGGSSPLWSPDGRELFYLSEDNSVMAVAVETERAINFGTPRMLFRNPAIGINAAPGTPWDIHPDGKRFLMIKEHPSGSMAASGDPRRINVVLNWFEELKQRVRAN